MFYPCAMGGKSGLGASMREAVGKGGVNRRPGTRTSVKAKKTRQESGGFRKLVPAELHFGPINGERWV